jgi:hypothetical protein
MTNHHPTRRGKNKSKRVRLVLLCLNVVALGCYFNLITNFRGLLSGCDAVFNSISSSAVTTTTSYPQAKQPSTTDARFRKFSSRTVGHTIRSLPPRDPDEIQQYSCTRWAISTALSTVVVNDTLLIHKGWCVLLVEENSSRPISLHGVVGGDRVIVLSEMVEEWTRTLLRSQNIALPLQGRNHQKHLGYLYAISHGAKLIVDLREDEQSLQFSLLRDLQELIPFERGVANLRYVIDNEEDFVPYAYFGDQNETEIDFRLPFFRNEKMEKNWNDQSTSPGGGCSSPTLDQSQKGPGITCSCPTIRTVFIPFGDYDVCFQLILGASIAFYDIRRLEGALDCTRGTCILSRNGFTTYLFD